MVYLQKIFSCADLLKPLAEKNIHISGHPSLVLHTKHHKRSPDVQPTVPRTPACPLRAFPRRGSLVFLARLLPPSPQPSHSPCQRRAHSSEKITCGFLTAFHTIDIVFAKSLWYVLDDLWMGTTY